MSFDNDALFPPLVSYGTSGGEGWGSIIHEMPSGASRRIPRRDSPLMRYDLTSQTRDIEHAAAVRTFLRCRRGGVYGFRYFDWNDFFTSRDGFTLEYNDPEQQQILGSGDGTTTRFKICKRYQDGYGYEDVRANIKFMRASEAQQVTTYPQLVARGNLGSGALHNVFKAGVQLIEGNHYNLDYDTDEVVFVTPPGAGEDITWTGPFVVPVRLDRPSDENTGMSLEEGHKMSFDTLNLIEEMLDTVPWPKRYAPGGSTAYTFGVGESERILQWSDGFLITIYPDAVASNPTVKLPVVDAEMFGGPLMIVRNMGSTRSVVMQWNNGTPLLTLAPGDDVELHLGLNAASSALWLAR